ncbi:maleylacetate reductase (plasmid) [Rhodococcus rhodochrous]|uniref:maleylacetate reductase n=1 Tax=Rhodococcus rhodochrous TaxID=1829 RepID=UPI00132F100F|nr:maleylacetate reductase [Rhodococcus rhodochrous]QHG85494.1 maleylacetate reductase [Rhodococcus rhodochrous]
MKFTHESMAQRVIFATGEAAASVVAEIQALQRSKVMLIASERKTELADPIEATLRSAGMQVVVRHEEVVMHVPVEVAERARVAAAAAQADIVVSIGGGSATGLGKAIVMDGSPVAGLPLIAVPTTYAGSEGTNVWGLTNEKTKTTGVDNRALPTSVVYDASLLTSLPSNMAVASGLNALAHSIDVMWGPRVDPIDRAFAGEGIRGLAAGLPLIAENPTSIEGIEQTLYGAYLSAVAFASAGSGMHHKICHVLGGMFNLPHAQTHAVVLPHVLAFNAQNDLEAEQRIAAAFGAVLGSGSATDGLRALRDKLGIWVDVPKALKDFGMPEDGVMKAVEPIKTAIPSDNPTPITNENLAALLRAAWEGNLP